MWHAWKAGEGRQATRRRPGDDIKRKAKEMEILKLINGINIGSSACSGRQILTAFSTQNADLGHARQSGIALGPDSRVPTTKHI